MTTCLPAALAALCLTCGALAQTLFDVAWHDPGPYRADLLDAGVLPGLEDAAVYHLRLVLSDDLATVTGEQEVRVTNGSPETWRELVFRLHANTLGSRLKVARVTVDGEDVEAALEGQDTVLRIPLAQGLAPGRSLTVALDYSLRLADDPRAAYGRLGRYPQVLSLAHGYPQLAVFEAGAWDASVPPDLADPTHAESAFYLVQVSAPAGQTLVASGAERSRVLFEDRQSVVFAAGPMRDFYLASAAGYLEQSVTVGQTTVRSYAPPELSAGSWRALGYAEDALASFNRRFGAYPFREFDIVAVPVRAGGIEYPGVINVANRLYPQFGGFFEGVVAHEVAHQWFYSLVGNDQLAEPWLDESLTQYATLLYYLDAYGPREADGYRRSLEDRWAETGYLEMPVGLPAEAYTPRTYGPIVYGRGALFFDALAEALGQDTLEAVLRDYTERYAFDLSDTEAFRGIAEERCACDLSALFDAWVYPAEEP